MVDGIASRGKRNAAEIGSRFVFHAKQTSFFFFCCWINEICSDRFVCSQKKGAPVKGKAVKGKKSASKFVVDCTTAETDSILDVGNFVSCHAMNFFAYASTST